MRVSYHRMVECLFALHPRKSPSAAGLYSADMGIHESDDGCVTWGTVYVPDSEGYEFQKPNQLSIIAQMNTTCAASGDYSFTILLEKLGTMNPYRIGNGMDVPLEYHIHVCCGRL